MVSQGKRHSDDTGRAANRFRIFVSALHCDVDLRQRTRAVSCGSETLGAFNDAVNKIKRGTRFTATDRHSPPQVVAGLFPSQESARNFRILWLTSLTVQHRASSAQCDRAPLVSLCLFKTGHHERCPSSEHLSRSGLSGREDVAHLLNRLGGQSGVHQASVLVV